MKKLLLVALTSGTITFMYSKSFGHYSCDIPPNVSPNILESDYYAKINTGVIFFKRTKDKATDIKLKPNTTSLIELGVGYKGTDDMRVDLTVNYIINPTMKKGTTFSPTIQTDTSIKHKANIMSLILSGYVDLLNMNPIKLVAGAGIGVARLNEKVTFSLPNIGFNNTFSSKTSTNFAYHLTVGLATELSPGIKGEIDYSWRDYGRTKPKNTFTLNNVSDRQTGKTPYKGHNVIAGLRFDI